MARSYTLTLLAFGVAAATVAAPVAGRQPDGVDAAERHHDLGIEHHMRREMDEASREYERTLVLDPPVQPSAAELATVVRLAPRLFVNGREPFPLKDVAAVIHPTRRLIAYHLFWDDDIDYPDDNDPSDHELLWASYDARGDLDGFWTYFHGRVLPAPPAALADARAHAMRLAVYAQWGKHGLMPLGWAALHVEADEGDTESEYYRLRRPITLEEYNRGTYNKLATEGARMADHPLARKHRWPARFDGTWKDFSRFPRLVEVRRTLATREMVAVSRWNSAVLNRRFLLYNFKPKVEWPEDEGRGR
jgi:hypothetical protein